MSGIKLPRRADWTLRICLAVLMAGGAVAEYFMPSTLTKALSWAGESGCIIYFFFSDWLTRGA